MSRQNLKILSIRWTKFKDFVYPVDENWDFVHRVDEIYFRLPIRQNLYISSFWKTKLANFVCSADEISISSTKQTIVTYFWNLSDMVYYSVIIVKNYIKKLKNSSTVPPGSMETSDLENMSIVRTVIR